MNRRSFLSAFLVTPFAKKFIKPALVTKVDPARGESFTGMTYYDIKWPLELRSEGVFSSEILVHPPLFWKLEDRETYWASIEAVRNGSK